MKTIKLLTAGLAALSCASLASAAQVELWITGATAYRQSVNAGIVDSLANCKVGYNGATPNIGGSSAAVFSGTFKNIASVPAGLRNKTAIIRTAWNGSAAGVQAVAQVSPIVALNFLADSAATGGDVTVAAGPLDANGNQTVVYTDSDGGAVGNPGIAASVPHAANLCFHDVTQGSTLYPAGTNTYVIDSLGNTASRDFDSLTSAQVGVVGFSWIRARSNDATLEGIVGNPFNINSDLTAGSIGAFSNVTSRQARSIISLGALDLGFFTGVAAHSSSYAVFLTGRDADSGTRVTTFVENALPSDFSPTQYRADVSGGLISNVVLFPATTLQGVFFDAGTSGEASGGTLVTKLKNRVSATATVAGAAAAKKFVVLSYASIADITNVANSAQQYQLAYNGERYSDVNVRNGKYSFWSIENGSYNEVASDARGINTAAALNKDAADFLISSTGPVGDTWSELSGVKLSTMNVSRSQEGADIL